MRTADVKLFNRAIRGRWPMSEETRARVIETLDHIVANPDRFDVRTVIAASKTLMEADRINLKDEDRTAKAPIMIEDNGTQRVDFSHMTDAEIDAYIARTRPRI